MADGRAAKDVAKDILLHTGHTELERTHHTRNLSDDALKRMAVKAAGEHDAEALWLLTRAYLEDTTDKGRLSPHTFKVYRHGVALFTEATGHENLLRPSRRMGSRYRAWLKEMPYGETKEGEPLYRAPSTINKTLAAARVLYKALNWAGASEATPFAVVKGMRDPVAAWEKVQPYPQADLKKLLSVLQDPADEVALLLCAHAGLRAHEAAALSWTQVDWQRKRLTVKGKGGYVDSVAMSSSLQRALRAYQNAPAAKRLRRTRQGKVLPFGDERLRQRLKKLCTLAGVNYRGLHALRHQAGTRMYQETGDLRRTQTHLRHKNIATTTIYAKVSERSVSDVTDEW